MKPVGASKSANKPVAEPKEEKIDFSKVEVEPLFKDFVDFELPASFVESYYRWHEWKPPNLQHDFGILRSLVGN